MDLKSLYQEILNEHNLNPTHKGVMENPTITLQGVNPSCGDNIYLQLKIDDNGVISEGSFNGSGCAVSQASVDMMLDDIIGKPKDEALRLASLFMDMIYGKVEDDDALEELDEAASLKNISKMRFLTFLFQNVENIFTAKSTTNPTNAVPERDAMRVAITKIISLEKSLFLLSNHIIAKYVRK